jgi:hypothetical protein
VNPGWHHWVVVHGNAKVAEEDVKGIGKEIGLDLSGVNHNRFEVLCGAGKDAKLGVVVGKEGEGGSVRGRIL